MTQGDYLCQGPISAQAVAELQANYSNKTGTGAQASFVGKVRADVLGGDQVIGIEYSAYEAMVNKELFRLKQEYMARYDDICAIEILHAVGKVLVGENAIAVVVSGGHRKQVFVAIAELVDDIKKHVPIWKRELLSDGGHVWTPNT